MYSFETLLRASSDELLAIFTATRVGPLDDNDARREQIAQQLGLRVPQLLCSVGFNAAVPNQGNICRVLGFAGFPALAAARNYAFIHDVYRALSINNILEIYSALNRLHEPGAHWADIVSTRMANLESQLEETINPILIGGYKLEVRAIYEHHLASAEFVRDRLTPNHAVMRDIANENNIMLEHGAIDPQEFLECTGLTNDEKRRVIFKGLIPPAVAEPYIRRVQPLDEQFLFREALAHSTAR
jgi:hypothetical protein